MGNIPSRISTPGQNTIEWRVEGELIGDTVVTAVYGRTATINVRY